MEKVNKTADKTGGAKKISTKCPYCKIDLRQCGIVEMRDIEKIFFGNDFYGSTKPGNGPSCDWNEQWYDCGNCRRNLGDVGWCLIMGGPKEDFYHFTYPNLGKSKKKYLKNQKRVAT